MPANNTVGIGKVYQYDLDGNFVREWKHCVEAHKTLGCSSHLHYHLKDKSKYKTIMGHIFTYEYYIKLPQSLIPKKTNSRVRKSILQIDKKTGCIIKDWGKIPIQRLAHSLGINKTSLTGCLNGVKYRNTCGGYIWKYKD